MIFQVPQFIEVEDKIFGPFTFKQFIYLVGGAASSFLIYAYVRHISVILAIILIVPVAVFFFVLAFQQINGRPAITSLEAAFKFAINRKLYLWKKSDTPKKQEVITLAKTESEGRIPRLSESKLKDLSWSLDIDKKI